MKKATVLTITLITFLALLAGCKQQKSLDNNTKKVQSSENKTKSNFDQTQEKSTPNQTQKKSPKTPRGSTKAIMKTSMGDIELELFKKEAPNTVANFIKLAKKSFYDGTIFHRVIPDFMIQGGDPTGTGRGGPGYQFDDEINNIKMVKGILAMANAGPNTNGSQFFIITAEETPWLQGKHTVFGAVTKGQDVAEKISQVDRDQQDKPIEDVVLKKVIIK